MHEYGNSIYREKDFRDDGGGIRRTLGEGRRPEAQKRHGAHGKMAHGRGGLRANKINTPFFVSNCDNLIDQDFRDVYEYHQNNQNDITIITSVKSYQIPYGVIETGPNGLLTNLTEKPEMTYMINTGVYILQPELINEIPSNHFFHITDLIIRLREKNGKIGCFPVSEKSWTDIGDWTEYNKILCKY